MTYPRYTHADRIKFARDVLRDQRLTQRSFRRRGGSGREYVCAISSFGPDIHNHLSCPSDFMPAWLAARIPGWFDNLVPSQIYAFQERLINLAERWIVLNGGDWAALKQRVDRHARTGPQALDIIEAYLDGTDLPGEAELKEIRKQKGPAIAAEIPIDIPMVTYKEPAAA